MPRRGPGRQAANDALHLWRRNNVDVLAAVEALLRTPEVLDVLKQADADYSGSLAVCKNLRQTLRTIRFQERYSGVKKAIIAAAMGAGVSQRQLCSLFQINRTTASAASVWREQWGTEVGLERLCHPTKIVRCVKDKQLPLEIIQWINDNTTPSSNTKNVVKVMEDGVAEDHVIHWRTETIDSMFHRCRLDVGVRMGESFTRTYFYSCIPTYVRLKKVQDGLCPIHHTGITLQKELIRKRAQWHLQCNCACAFCSAQGCNHGKSPSGGVCSMFTCTHCKGVKCPREWREARTSWLRPVQRKREGGGINWTNELYIGSRTALLTTMTKEMATYNTHATHVEYHKQQMRDLLDNFPVGTIVIKCDFIQNIVHSRGRETSASYYGKRQTQLLSIVVWYHALENGVMTKQKMFVDYLSSYLKHNSLFFQKCLVHLLTYLRDDIGVEFNKVYIDTDGGKAHFKSRISFFFASTLPSLFGVVVHWIFDPSNHGKGECDSHGAVVKRGIRLFVLDDEHHIDDEQEAAAFINDTVRATTAFIMDVLPEETEMDCTPLTGSSKLHELRFAGTEGAVDVRRYPCCCAECLDDNFEECTNADVAGTFASRTMRRKKERIPTARFPGGTHVLNTEQGDFIVSAIVGSRMYEGKYQYEVVWEGFEDTTWVEADKLKCIEMIEDYEANRE